jgi:hypothetical protein
MVVLLLIRAMLLNLSFMFFVEVKAAITNSKVLEACGGCDSITNPLFDFIKSVQHSSTKKNKDNSEAALLPQALLLTDCKEIA